jgi:hypothetical protein
MIDQRMDPQLEKGIGKLIFLHRAAVEVDTLLDCSDGHKLANKAKKSWAAYHEYYKEFAALLKRCEVK